MFLIKNEGNECVLIKNERFFIEKRTVFNEKQTNVFLIKNKNVYERECVCMYETSVCIQFCYFSVTAMAIIICYF